MPAKVYTNKDADIREIVQSGTVAIGRGSRSITERARERVSA